MQIRDIIDFSFIFNNALEFVIIEPKAATPLQLTIDNSLAQTPVVRLGLQPTNSSYRGVKIQNKAPLSLSLFSW